MSKKEPPIDFAALEKRVKEEAEKLDVPLNPDSLVQQGIIRKVGAWYEVLDWDRMPEHAIAKIRSGQIAPGAGKPRRVQFLKRK